jgi:hypothetical protein
MNPDSVLLPLKVVQNYYILTMMPLYCERSCELEPHFIHATEKKYLIEKVISWLRRELIQRDIQGPFSPGPPLTRS